MPNLLNDILNFRIESAINYIKVNPYMVNYCNQEGLSPLMAACFIENFELVKMLCEHGANIHYLYNDKNNALMLAISKKNKEITKYLLLKGAFIYVKNNINHMLFINYLQNPCMPSSAQVFLSKNLERYSSICQIFQSQSIDKIYEQYGYESIGWAISIGHMQAVKYFLEKNICLINSQDEKGETLLIKAIQFEQLEIIGLILSHGADINYQDSQGYTLLMHAVLGGNFDIVYYLVHHGADTISKNNEKKDAFYLANELKQYDIAKYLFQIRKNIIEAFIYIMVGDLMSFQESASRVPFFYQIASTADRSLVIASRLGDLSIIEFLLEQGVNINSRVGLPFNPITLALEHHHDLVAAYLKFRGGQEATISQNDLEPLYNFIMNLNIHEICEYIKQYPVVIYDSILSETLLKKAVLTGNIEVIDCLFKLGIRSLKKLDIRDSIFVYAACLGYGAIVEYFLQHPEYIEISEVEKKLANEYLNCDFTYDEIQEADSDLTIESRTLLFFSIQSSKTEKDICLIMNK